MAGVTPRISDHARERCAQMGISTKVAKRIFRSDSGIDIPDFQGNMGRRFRHTKDEPGYAIVVEGDVVVTVLYYSPGAYFRRDEAT